MDPADVTAALGELVLERLADGRFVRRGAPPPWCAAIARAELGSEAPFLLDELFPFMAAFLPLAEAAWRCVPPERADSGFWTEIGHGGEEVHLEAAAVRVGGARLLVIRRNEPLFAEQQLVLQRARELRLTHHELMRELELRDILVHSIVHDLAAPLHGILGSLSLLGELPLPEPGARWLATALQAATRQRQLIAEILDVFSVEHGGLAPPDASQRPDLAQAIDRVLVEAEPTRRARGVELRADLPEGSWRVAAEETRLVRVIANLVDNALRYTPRGGRIRVSARRDADAVEVAVENEGPPVAAEVLPYLFERFGRGGERAAGTGLGLYFCRIMAELWGGAIGYERPDPGRSRFWLRLRDAGTERHHGEAVAP